MSSLHNNFISSFITNANVTCSFSSSYEIFETQYKCTIGADEYKESVIESQYIKPFLSDGTLSDSISTDCVFFSIKDLDRSLDYEGTLEPINNINSVLIPFTINGYK